VYSINLQCRVLKVSRSGYYAWLKRAPSAHKKQDLNLLDRIKQIHHSSRGTYGAPRVLADIKESGTPVGQKRVARLMASAGLVGVTRRRRVKTTRRSQEAVPAPDLVNRNFRAEAPNKLWVADITYIPTWSGFLYLSVVIDVFSRRVIGWAMERHLRTELVLKAQENGRFSKKDCRSHSSFRSRDSGHLDRLRAEMSGGRRETFDRIGW
jgi:putative transposase